MKNKEKFTNELVELSIDSKGLAVVNGKPRSCDEVECGKCEFNIGGSGSTFCVVKRQIWANEEYTEKINWNNVKDGTPIWVRDSDDEGWSRKTFAFCHENRIFAHGGADDMYVEWRQAILTNLHEEKQNG